jgi:drug/metabolite transporter (DMT)-like permease
MEALAHIPLVEATALGFTTPFFGTLLAAMFLGERIRIRRITAITLGFAGVVVVLDPRDATLDPYALAALLCALTAAIYAVLLRRISTEFHPNALVSYVFLFLIPLTGIPAAPVWSVPSWDAAQSLIAVGILGTLGHLCMARAWASAEIAVVGPFDYVQLVFAAAIGYALLGEHPQQNVWIGAALIIASAVYIARREAFLGRTRGTKSPRAPETHP